MRTPTDHSDNTFETNNKSAPDHPASAPNNSPAGKTFRSGDQISAPDFRGMAKDFKKRVEYVADGILYPFIAASGPVAGLIDKGLDLFDKNNRNAIREKLGREVELWEREAINLLDGIEENKGYEQSITLYTLPSKNQLLQGGLIKMKVKQTNGIPIENAFYFPGNVFNKVMDIELLVTGSNNGNLKVWRIKRDDNTVDGQFIHDPLFAAGQELLLIPLGITRFNEGDSLDDMLLQLFVPEKNIINEDSLPAKALEKYTPEQKPSFELVEPIEFISSTSEA
jgi:hypothetical protein